MSSGFRFKVFTTCEKGVPVLDHTYLMDARTCDEQVAQLYRERLEVPYPDLQGLWLYVGAGHSLTELNSAEMLEHTSRYLRHIMGMTDADEVVYQHVYRTRHPIVEQVEKAPEDPQDAPGLDG